MITIIARKAYSLPFNRISFGNATLNVYRFYVDFKGIMYFDDGGPISPTNIIKDKKFIQKFYQSLKRNNQSFGNYFPYVG